MLCAIEPGLCIDSYFIYLPTLLPPPPIAIGYRCRVYKSLLKHAFIHCSALLLPLYYWHAIQLKGHWTRSNSVATDYDLQRCTRTTNSPPVFSGSLIICERELKVSSLSEIGNNKRGAKAASHIDTVVNHKRFLSHRALTNWRSTAYSETPLGNIFV